MRLNILLLFLLGSQMSSCSLSREENRPLLHALDQALPEADPGWETAGQALLVAPAALPAGVLDSLLIHPIMEIPESADLTYNSIWKDPEGTAFYQAAVFLPKVAVTPMLFTIDWLWSCFFQREAGS